MFSYPPQTLFNRMLPKSKIYAHAKPGRAVKELFVSRIGEIVWKHKLSPETLKLPARRGIMEIQVFEIALKSDECEAVLLRTIDRAIPFPILFQLTHANSIRFAASYKRPSDADASQWVIEASFVHPWQSATTERPPLPVALDLAALHDQLIRRHIPLAPRPGESIRDHVARHLSIEVKQREAQQLESRLAKEKQFNRKVELNAALRALRQQILDLDGERTRHRVQSPAPSPETCVDQSLELSPPSTPPGREGATRNTRGRVCSPNQEFQP